MTFLAQWKKNDGPYQGATVAADAEGGGSGSHDGVWTWGSYGQLNPGGPYGMHVRNQTGGYVSSIGNPADLRLLGNITVAAWIHADDYYYWSDSNPRYIVNCTGTDDTQAQNDLWSLEVVGDRALRFRWENGVGVDVVVDSDDNILPIQGWSHVIVVRYEVVAGKWGIRFYVDGSLASTKDNGGAGWDPPDGGGSSLPYVGRRGGSVSGTMWMYASVRIYDTAEDDAGALAIYSIEDTWLDDITIFDWAAIESMIIEEPPGDPYTVGNGSPATIVRSDAPGDPYTIFESGPNSLHENTGWVKY